MTSRLDSVFRNLKAREAAHQPQRDRLQGVFEAVNARAAAAAQQRQHGREVPPTPPRGNSEEAARQTGTQHSRAPPPRSAARPAPTAPPTVPPTAPPADQPSTFQPSSTCSEPRSAAFRTWADDEPAREEAACRRRGASTAAQLFVAMVDAAAAKFLPGLHTSCGTPAAARKLLMRDLALALHPDKNRQLPVQQRAARSAWLTKLNQLSQAARTAPGPCPFAELEAHGALLPKSCWVAGVNGSAPDKCKAGYWIDLWKLHSGACEPEPRCCAVGCRRPADRGAHMWLFDQAGGQFDKDSCYIAPVCPEHNQKGTFDYPTDDRGTLVEGEFGFYTKPNT